MAHGEVQRPAPKGSIAEPLVIGWGRQDRVCLPSQSRLALEKFPDARLYWFEHCGHFPQWDQPAEAARLILAVTGGELLPEEFLVQANPAKATPKLPHAALVVAVLALLAGGLWRWSAQRRLQRPPGA
ncbi:alpha/beta fold hydrolase [Hymenobacter aerophilus]|uniref:alpha/beta fold hydrolase n=1 Tax=Hymenobacter aerophilus TaxID=119644 RepID=UPI0012F8DB58|nr:hypothetical protein [Hymenobacter aerophilus]